MPLAVRHVAEPAGHLHHEVGAGEEEVDACDVDPVLAVDDLAARAGQLCVADEAEEPSFEVRLAARIEQE